MIEPIFKELAKLNPGIKFIHIDIDDASESMPSELSGIRGVPTFRCYKGGKMVGTFSGANTAKLGEFVDLLNKKEEEKKEEKKEEEKKEEEKEEKKEEEPKKEEKKEEEKKEQEAKKEEKNEDEVKKQEK